MFTSPPRLPDARYGYWNLPLFKMPDKNIFHLFSVQLTAHVNFFFLADKLTMTMCNQFSVNISVIILITLNRSISMKGLLQFGCKKKPILNHIP